MTERFRQHLESGLNFLQNQKLLIAVSGGLDSVVLAHLCHDLKLDFAIAHCNFNLRDSESDADEAFVKALAENWNVKLHFKSFETEAYASEKMISIQMAARELRYAWFQKLAEKHHFDYILTAHHADDNLETFLINLIRGTGLEGLTGIPEVSGKIVRPLLPFSREELEVFAKQSHLEWREDSSNASNKYVRNKLRHDVIPELKDINPKLLHNFQTTIANLQDSENLIEDAVVKLQKKVAQVEENVIKLNIRKLKKRSNPKAYLYQLLKDFNFTAWDDVVNLLDAQPGKQVFSSTHRLLKDREFLLLSELGNDEDEERITHILKYDTKIETPAGHLHIEPVEAISDISRKIIYVDADQLKYPLTVRKWHEGDLFFPFGMQGKKKLSKYFKDEKLSLYDKESAWVLCSEQNIVWVIGRRADDRFKITETTEHILKIKIH